MTIWRMRIAGWIPEATNNHSEYVILLLFFFFFFTAKMVTRKRLNVLLHVHCLSCSFWRNNYEEHTVVSYYRKLHSSSQICRLTVLNVRHVWRSFIKTGSIILCHAGPSGRSVQRVGLRPLVSWDWGLESRQRHDVSLVNVVVFASGWSLFQRSLTECVLSECDRKALTQRRGPGPLGGCRTRKESYTLSDNCRQF